VHGQDGHAHVHPSLDEALTKARPDAHNGWTRRGLSPFDYQRRMGAVLADGPEGLTLIVKGAPEAVVEACASADGAPFDAAARKAALARVQDLAASGLRAVAVASRPWAGPPRDPPRRPDHPTLAEMARAAPQA
jgi:Mg2+-importing ATPase